MQDVFPLLVPSANGEEMVEIDTAADRYTAFAGTGFRPDGDWKRSELLRYAIAVQQLRDQKRYDEASAVQKWLRGAGIAIGTAKDRTVATYAPEPKTPMRSQSYTFGDMAAA